MLVSDSCDDDDVAVCERGRGGNRNTEDDVVGFGEANNTGDVIMPLHDERMEGSDAVHVLVTSL